MELSRVPVRDQTTHPSSPSSTKLLFMAASCFTSMTPVCWGQPVPGKSRMRAVSAQSLAMATELPTMPVVNSTTSVSATTMSAVRRMRRFRTRSRACSRYSTRPAESGSSDTGRGPRCLFLILSCPFVQ